MRGARRLTRTTERTRALPHSLTPDQEFFAETTARFLDEQAPVAELRRLRDDTAGFEREYWRRGAELGWTSLLVPEGRGGGTVGDQGLLDLALVAFEFGRHAAPGPLVPVNVVAAALGDAADGHGDVLAGLLAGTTVAVPCDPAAGSASDAVVEVREEGDQLVVRGTVQPVEAATAADFVLVTGRDEDGLRQVLVPSDAAGLSIVPMRSVDLTRRFGAVTFDSVRLPRAAAVGAAGAGDAVRRQRQLALALLNAESVGAMQTGFDGTVEWAFDRFSFGRPLASYQALKHRFADMKSWLEGGHAVADAAAAATAAGADEAAGLLSAAKAFIGDYGGELLQDCVQLHGGMGLTFEHDLHLFLRRHTVNRAYYGTPADHRRHLGSAVLGPEEAA